MLSGYQQLLTVWDLFLTQPHGRRAHLLQGSSCWWLRDPSWGGQPGLPAPSPALAPRAEASRDKPLSLR